MSQSFLILDATNLFFRARHTIRSGDIDTKIGMCHHIIMASINKVWRDFDGSHVVICLEGRNNWRKTFYPPYKRNRKEARAALAPAEAEEEQLMLQAFDELCQYFRHKTNCTVLQHDEVEADDLIARWVQNHPNDQHVIISSDSDFYQMLTPTVSIYNGITSEHIKLDGVYNVNGKKVIDKKTKEPKNVGDPEWLLFEKCIRGDKSDNIFSAYPGARKKGTKNKIGMTEAFEDKEGQGFNWNNFMLQRWVDENEKEHRVLDDYQRNMQLVDLTAQPDHIKEKLDEAIATAIAEQDNVQGVGIHFMKFCGKWNLVRISEQSTSHVQYLNARYKVSV